TCVTQFTSTLLLQSKSGALLALLGFLTTVSRQPGLPTQSFLALNGCKSSGSRQFASRRMQLSLFDGRPRARIGHGSRRTRKKTGVKPADLPVPRLPFLLAYARVCTRPRARLAFCGRGISHEHPADAPAYAGHNSRRPGT